MSKLHVFLEKIESALVKVDDILIQKSNNASIDDNYVSSVLNGIEEGFGEPDEFLGGFIDKISDSKIEDEEKIIEEFCAEDSFKRNALIKFLELIVKVSRLENGSDLEKQEYWWEKLKSLA